MLGQGMTALGLALGSRVLTEYAAPTALGQYKLAIGLVGLFSGLFFRPFIQYVMRAYHDAKENGLALQFLAYSRSTVAKAALIFGVLMFVSLSAYGLITQNIQLSAALVAGALVFFHSGLSFQNGVLVTQNRQGTANIIRPIMQCGVPLAAAAGALLLGQFGFSLAIGEFVLLAVVYWVSSRILGLTTGSKTSDAQKFAWSQEARRFVVPLIGVGVFSWATSMSDRYILAIFASPKEVGLYSAAYGLGAQPILMLTGIAAQLVYPFLFSAAAKSRKAAQTQILGYLTLATTICAVGAVLGIAVFGDWIVRALLAENYRDGAQSILLWVSGGYALLGIAASFEMKSFAAKKTLVVGTSYGLAALANVSLNFLWIPTHGALGAAKATFFGYLVYLIVLAFLHWQQSKIK